MLTFKQFIKEHLIVSRKLKSGRVKHGKRGWIHSDLLTQKEMNSKKPIDTSGMGFSKYPKGKWMSRKQAHNHMKKNEPDNLNKRKIKNFHSSDIRNHNKIRDW